MCVSNLQQSEDKNCTAVDFAVLSGSSKTNLNLPELSRVASTSLYSFNIKKAAIAKSDVS